MTWNTDAAYIVLPFTNYSIFLKAMLLAIKLRRCLKGILLHQTHLKIVEIVC